MSSSHAIFADNADDEGVGGSVLVDGVGGDAPDVELGSCDQLSECSTRNALASTQLESKCDSLAPTEIDEDVISISSDEGETFYQDLDTLTFWICHSPRFQRLRPQIEATYGLSFNLPPWGVNLHTHACSVIQSMLTVGYIKGFKIGITFVPIWRWQQYKAKKYKKMILVAVHENSDVIAMLERSLIAVFRKYCPRGILCNPWGHHLCENRNPGGESAHHGCSPFFCYVCKR